MTIVLTIQPDQHGLRLDKVIGDAREIGSRSRAASLIARGFVTANGRLQKASYRVQIGDVISIAIPTPEPSELRPLNLRLEILYEDSDCAVVNKPAGLVVHPAAGHAQDTLVNALLHQVHSLSMGFGEERPGIVHRLDKDTSGLLVVAKNDSAHRFLADQFRLKTVHRIYWALVYGVPVSREKTITSKLARHPDNRKRFASRSEGRIAITHYSVLKSNRNVSLLQCRLETGRTHQIRVHLSELGHAILGDRIYGSTRRGSALSKELQTKIQTLHRIGLHACELGFEHPRSRQFMKFFAPWPEDLRPLVEDLELLGVSAGPAQ